MNPDPAQGQTNKFKLKGVVVMTTAMLTFITFWKAAAIVLCDFGSSAFYAGSIAMKAIGPAFPWYILAIMIFAGPILLMYIEACSMFTRGGIFPVVKAGLGENAAKAATAAILFDFLLTGPISGISAGQYIVGFLNSVLEYFNTGIALSGNGFSILFAIAVTIYFWRQNIKGIEDSSDKNSRIIKFSVMICAALVIWAVISLFIKDDVKLPPFTPQFTQASLGWAADIPFLKHIGVFGVIMALGHSVLALSGIETLAQVFREIEYPKIQNLKKAALIIFVFALVFTGGLTFLAALLIPQELISAKYQDNLLAGLAMSLSGPTFLKLILQACVVAAGAVMLSGAVNTSVIGANGLMSRMAETGILTDWFRKIHPKYGTTYHMINMICMMQILVILFSRGNLYLIGQAYAFGVLWSFVFELSSIVVLRFKEREKKREFIMPLNFKFDHYLIPVGGILVAAVVVVLALTNLITKQVATVTGLSFAAFFFLIFNVSERMNAQKANDIFEEGHREKLNHIKADSLEKALTGLEGASRVLVAVRDPENMYPLDTVLKDIKDEDTDIIVLYVKPVEHWRIGKTDMARSVDENELFTNIILTAEKYGHHVFPIEINSNEVFYAISQVAIAAKVKEIVMGVSGSYGAHDQMERLVMAWGVLQNGQPHIPMTARILWEGREVSYKF